LKDRFDAKGIAEGFNFRFGHKRLGTIDTLREKCAGLGIPFRVVEPFQIEGGVVSSSRVRNALMDGAVKTAAELLNRPYQVSGSVIAGAKRGRTMGFPTANLDGVTTLLPKDGVYAVRAFIDGAGVAGAANIGPNPTFGESARKIEVHLIGFDGDLYGKTITIDFIERLRDTLKFNDVAELTEQMRRDVEQARQLLANDDLKVRVETVLRAEVAPALELDGTAIEVINVVDGVARLRLNGVCAGCPTTIWTLINGIEQELRQRIPEIEYLEAAP
jgi:riboflavin kinase/FMN adenylyltransferase